jgi:sensor histidine kinase regulating citrate/malate metabolism
VEPSERGLWNSISQLHQEEMVYEISDLLHRRLVSGTLASEFRSVMELHVQVKLHCSCLFLSKD